MPCFLEGGRRGGYAQGEGQIYIEIPRRHCLASDIGLLLQDPEHWNDSWTGQGLYF